VVNFGGIQTIDIHCVWKIKVPPKIHFFLWLLSHNKLLTRDNLVKRKNVDDLTCVFCNEIESCQHLFFDCVVAANMWEKVLDALGLNLNISNIHDVAALWADRKKYKKCNLIFAAVLRAIWITRNDHVFNRVQWFGMQALWRRLLNNCAQWKILLKEEEKEGLIGLMNRLEGVARLPPMILWPDPG
jgi:hypothetical protein